MVDENIKIDAIPFTGQFSQEDSAEEAKKISDQLFSNIEDKNSPTTTTETSKTTAASTAASLATATTPTAANSASATAISTTSPINMASDSLDNYRESRLANRVEIHGDNTVLNLCPTINYSVVGPSYTQVTQVSNNTQEKPKNMKEVPDKELLRPLFSSQRVLSDDDIEVVSKNLGCNWRDVGNRLMFNWSQLDQFQQETKSNTEAAFKMLYRWLQWKDEKATVGKLAKALFMADEFDAILVLQE